MRQGSANSGMAGSVGCTSERQPGAAIKTAANRHALTPRRQHPCGRISVTPQAAREPVRRRLRESFRAFCPECRTCRVLLELGFPVAYGSFGVIGRLAEWEGGDVEGNGRRGEQMM